MNVIFPYGKDGLEITVPDSENILLLQSQSVPPIKNPENLIYQCLKSPIVSPPLFDVARDKKDAIILISDITRPVPNTIILPPILATLSKAGISRKNVTIMIATGIHRAATEGEVVELVGEDIARDYTVISHDARNEKEMRLIGDEGDTMPVYIDRRYLDADLKIITGYIEPHLLAGYSGGRKAIMPGVAGLETMRWAHGADMIGHPRARYGMLDENPFHQASLKAAQLTGADFLLNVTLDREKRVTGVFAGDLEEAHRQGCAFVKSYVTCSVPHSIDVAVVSGGGYPLDKTLYQSIKGIVSAAPIVRKGSTILLLARCEEGIGSKDFIHVLDSVESIPQFFDMIRQPDYFHTDQWMAQHLYEVVETRRVMVLTEGVTASDLSRYLLYPVRDLRDAVLNLIDTYSPDAQLALIPEGPYLINRIEGE